MKRVFSYAALFIVLLLMSGSLSAQSNKEDIDIIQASFGKDKKELVSAYMQVNAKDSAAFWKLYDEYEDKRKAIGRERIMIIEQYAENYDSLTNSKASQLATSTLANNAKYNDLYQTYFKKFSNVVGGKNAAKLFQLEMYVETIVRQYIMDQIPYIGELEKSKNNP